MNKTELSIKIKNKANALGFIFCGIAKADFLEKEAPLLDQWLRNNYQGNMHYMNNYFDKRLDPRLLVDDAKSVISVGLNYYTSQNQTDANAPKISKYAYGTDYHFVLKEKLSKLLQFIENEIGEFNGRVFVDSAPVLDKVWAQKAGGGWLGKHSNLINKQSGSFFFLGELILDVDLDYDDAFHQDYCGTCTRCIDACPTEAIVAPYVVDGSKCISYLTIELKENLPHSFKGKMDNWMFGCDVCQDVCPWNRFSKPHTEDAFNPHPDLLEMTKRDWEEITEETFGKLFKSSAVKRTKYQGLKRNINFLKPLD